MRKFRYFAATLVLFTISGLSVAFANTLTATSPTAGSVLTLAPNAISMTTAMPLIDKGNSIVVNDPNGIDVSDGSISVTGNNAVIGLKTLTVTGVYTVNYWLFAPNEAPVAGSYTFQFNAPSVITSPSIPVVSPSHPQTFGAGQGVSSGANTLVYVLLILAFLVFVFLLIYAKQTFGRPKKRTRKSS